MKKITDEHAGLLFHATNLNIAEKVWNAREYGNII